MSTRFEYRYVVSLKIILLTIVFFSVCAAILGYIGVYEDRRVSILYMIDLSIEQTRIFYLVLSATSLTFVLMGFILLFSRGRGDKTIVLTNERLVIPRPMRRTSAEIEVGHIESAQEMKVARSRHLSIRYRKGGARPSILVGRASFENEAAFQDFKRRLAEAVLLSRQAPAPSSPSG